MALNIDSNALELVRSHRRRKPNSSLWLHAVRTPRSGWTATVDWIEEDRSIATATLQRVNDIPVWVDERLTPYVTWKPVTLTAARSGPFRSVMPADPVLMFHIRDWERQHPGLRIA
jgi:hypothetical protein